MGYSKKFDPSRYIGLIRHLEAIEALGPNGFYELVVPEPLMGRVRLLVYDWLYHKELKELFKVRTLKGRLLVERKPLLEVEGRALGVEEERVERAVRKALGAKEPGRMLREELEEEPELLSKALKALGKALGRGGRE